jgi:hypothetical protein
VGAEADVERLQRRAMVAPLMDPMRRGEPHDTEARGGAGDWAIRAAQQELAGRVVSWAEVRQRALEINAAKDTDRVRGWVKGSLRKPRSE